MKKLIVILTYLITSFSLSANEGIQVTGKSSVKVMPDLFSLTIQVKERSTSVTKAKKTVDHKSELIVAMFLKQGIKSENIDSAKLNVYPIYEKPSITFESIELHKRLSKEEKLLLSNAQKNSQDFSLTQFDVTRTIKVSFQKLSVYDQVLDRILKLGGSHISPVEMMIRNPEQHYETALLQALDNARDKAVKIASKAEVTLGKLTALVESGYHMPSVYRMASEAKSSFNSQITKKSITAQVTVTYEIGETK